MSVRDLSANQEAVGRVINSTSETVNNRTQVYYKIQMDIIGRCFTIIELDDALSVYIDFCIIGIKLSQRRYLEGTWSLGYCYRI